MTDNYTQQRSEQHKCPNCGAALVYDPKSGKLRCDHCETLIDFDQDDNVRERDFDELETNKEFWDSDITCYRCSNCGAVVVSPRTSLSTACPYCSSPVVIDDSTGSIVKPDSVMPFEVTVSDAAKRLLAWRKRRIFAPRKFRKMVGEESLKGVFVPAWTFDADTSTQYSGTVGYHRTRTVHRDGKTYTETYTEWRHVSGVIDMPFDDIFVRANNNIPENFFRKLQPYPQNKYRVYSDEYLAGYLADHYTVEPMDAFSQAQNQMRSQIRERIVSVHHADVEGQLDLDMEILSKTFKYMMLPVYIVATKYNNKVYNQYVSGVYSEDDKKQCKVCGKAPVSVWKVLIAVLLGLCVLAGFGYLVYRAMISGEIDMGSDWEFDFSYLKYLPPNFLFR